MTKRAVPSGSPIASVVWLLLGIVGCAEKAKSPSTTSGVAEAENGVVIWPPSPPAAVIHISPQDMATAPYADARIVLTLGTGERGEQDEFGTIGGIALDSSKRIYIWDVLNSRVRVYTPAGRFVRDIGRSGSGPGEFKSPHGARMRQSQNGIGISHDTVFVLDEQVRAFDTAGIYLASSGDELPFYNTNFVAPTPGGLTYQFLMPGEPTTSLYEIVTADFVNSAARVDSFAIVQRYYDYDDSWKVPILPLPNLQYHVSSRGAVYFVVDDSFHVDVRHLDGTLVTSYLGMVEKVGIASSDIQDMLESHLLLTRRGQLNMSDAQFERGIAAGIRERYAKRAVAKHRPAIGGIISSPAGDVLVLRPDLTKRPYRYYMEDNDSEWTMFNGKGEVTARLKLPTSFYPKVFEGCSLYGIRETEDGVPLVVVYELAYQGCR